MHNPWNPLSSYLLLTYGGKRAFALLLWHVVRASFGAFGGYRRIDWPRVSRVVFVCKGNICRSAFAAQRFRNCGIEAISGGLDADSGKPADPRAAKVARRFGIDLSRHRSTHISELELGDGDLLAAFEPEQADRLRRLPACSSGAQVTLVGLWAPLPGMAYLHDPYGLPEPYFELCFDRIERGLEGMRIRCADARAVREKIT
jgi:protein-tyrosine phosphatase